MITTIALANTSLLSKITISCGGEEFLRSLLTLKYYTVLLAIIIMLSIRSPQVVNLVSGSLYPLTNIFPCPSLYSP